MTSTTDVQIELEQGSTSDISPEVNINKQGKLKAPRRLIHCSDGTIEEYSSDESDTEEGDNQFPDTGGADYTDISHAERELCASVAGSNKLLHSSTENTGKSGPTVSTEIHMKRERNAS